MKLIIGLGNPGKLYEKTYHNTGFMVIDELAKTVGVVFSKTDCKALCASFISQNKEKIILAKPQTFMNLSGESVAQISHKYKILPKDIIVICDDVDLDLGVVRYRMNGSGGTHNGLKNIVQMLNSSDFQRIKIGVGRDVKMDLADYVLSKVNDDVYQVLKTSFSKAVGIALEKINADN